MSEQQPGSEQQGFEFPCEIPVKAMGAAGKAFRERVAEIIGKHTPVIPQSIRTTPSKNGKYESVTVTVMVRDREQLEQIYHDLSSDDSVLWTL